MKQKLIKWSASILSTCLAMGWFIGCDIPSIVLLGEYSYPQSE